jgi:hypothetical protein
VKLRTRKLAAHEALKWIPAAPKGEGMDAAKMTAIGGGAAEAMKFKLIGPLIPNKAI